MNLNCPTLVDMNSLTETAPTQSCLLCFFTVYLKCNKFGRNIQLNAGSPVAPMVKILPTVQETWVWSLAQKDPLERGMATDASVLAWRNPWTEEPGELQSWGSQRVGHDWATNIFTGLDLIMVNNNNN